MTSALLLVRGLTEVRPALAAAGGLLAHHRRGAAPAPELLGVWLRPALDEDLPARLLPASAAPGGVWIDETVGFSGWWALAWLQGPGLRAAGHAAARRQAVLDALADAGADEPAPGGRFIPVFAATDAVGLVEASMRALRARHPRLVAGRWLVDEHAAGPSPYRAAADRSPAAGAPRLLTLVHGS